MWTDKIKTKTIIIVAVTIVLLIFSLYRFYYTGIRLGMAIATSEPRGDFMGVFPVYWAWKLNPKLISQNHTTIDASNGLSNPFIFMDDFKPPLSIKRLCQIISADKYDISFSTQDNTIDRLNEIIMLSDFYDKVSEIKSNINFSDEIIYLVGITNNLRKQNNRSIPYLEGNPDFYINEFREHHKDPNKLYQAINQDGYKFAEIKAHVNTIVRLNEMLQHADFYKQIIINKNIVLPDELDSKIRRLNYQIEKYNNKEAVKIRNRLIIEYTYQQESPKAYFEDTSLNIQKVLGEMWYYPPRVHFLLFYPASFHIPILNRLILEETYPSETPKMQRMWHYGPFMHFFTFPLMFIDSLKSAFKIWLICCIIFLGVSIYLWYKILASGNKLHSLTVLTGLIFIWLNFAPLYEGFTTVVIEIFELFLLSLSFYYFFSKRREVLSGVFLGFAAMTKFLPFIFIPYFFLKKKYKLFMSSLITCGLLAILAEVTLGWKGNTILPRLATPGAEIWEWFYLQSIPNMINRLYSENFGYGTHPKLIYPNAAKLTSYIVMASIILFSAFIFFKKRESKAVNFEIAILSILMIAITQHSHYYYLMLLLIPFSLALQYILITYQKCGKVNKYDMLILGTSFFLVGVGIPMSIFKKIFSYLSIDFLEFYLGFSLPGWGYLVLLGWFYVKYITGDTTKEYFVNT